MNKQSGSNNLLTNQIPKKKGGYFQFLRAIRVLKRNTFFFAEKYRRAFYLRELRDYSGGSLQHLNGHRVNLPYFLTKWLPLVAEIYSRGQILKMTTN